jgi:hypothetical protein
MKIGPAKQIEPLPGWHWLLVPLQIVCARPWTCYCGRLFWRQSRFLVHVRECAPQYTSTSELSLAE